LRLRLLLASHLTRYLRNKLKSEKGYTATAGISTNKVLAKLVGNQYKPNDQTTLLPPYVLVDGNMSDNVTLFMDDHEIGKIPGIGFKISQKLRAHVLERPADFNTGLVYGATKEKVYVRDVRQYPGMGPEALERLLGGSGAPQGVGARVWDLFNGCDRTEVGFAREVPTQISIEDSYLRLDNLSEVTKELHILATSLLKRMHTDLLEDEGDNEHAIENRTTTNPFTHYKRWLAHPKTIRLSTRPRPPQNPDGSRNRSFARISRSAPIPGFVFSLKDSVEAVVERLVNETLLPLFRRLHPEKSGWNLSLVNIAVANIADAAREKGGVGRNIAKMFRQQDEVLKEWRVGDNVEVVEEQHLNEIRPQQQPTCSLVTTRGGSEDIPTSSQQTDGPADHKWDDEDEDMVDEHCYHCMRCSAIMPLFALGAHERFHAND
jgi:DNA polymerase iota